MVLCAAVASSSSLFRYSSIIKLYELALLEEINKERVRNKKNSRVKGEKKEKINR